MKGTFVACGHCGSHMHPIGACPNMAKKYTAQSRKPGSGRWTAGKNVPPQQHAQLKRKFPQEVEVDHHVGKGHRVNNKDAPIKQYRRKGNPHTVKPAGKTAKQAKAAAKSSGCLLMTGLYMAILGAFGYLLNRLARKFPIR